MFHWYLVFGLLTVEVITLVFLVLPMSMQMKRPLLRFLAFIGRNTSTKTALMTIGAILGVIFLDCIRTIYILSAPGATASTTDASGRADTILLTKLYSVERNAYLSGFTLFFLGFLSRFRNMANDMLQLEEKAKIAEQAHPNTTRLVEEKQYIENKAENLKRRLVSAEDKLQEAEKTADVRIRGGE